MRSKASVVEFIKTLCKSEPIREHGDDEVSDLKRPIFRREASIISISEPTAGEYKVTEAVADINQRFNERGENISHEEVPEFYFTKRSNDDMRESA